ncbi:MAG TPA: hypothetical protein VFS43_21345 [Polyangiaceae bacterium]|nr:hypothetical protein [Polyangiaceae bacterium]
MTTRTMKAGLDEHGILHVVGLEGAVHTLADAHENVRAVGAFVGTTPRPTLIDLRDVKYQEREARELYASPEGTGAAMAFAVLVGSSVSRVIGNMFLIASRPPVPTRLFSDKAEALAWLRTFL